MKSEKDKLKRKVICIIGVLILVFILPRIILGRGSDILYCKLYASEFLICMGIFTATFIPANMDNMLKGLLFIIIGCFMVFCGGEGFYKCAMDIKDPVIKNINLKNVSVKELTRARGGNEYELKGIDESENSTTFKISKNIYDAVNDKENCKNIKVNVRYYLRSREVSSISIKN